MFRYVPFITNLSPKQVVHTRRSERKQKPRNKTLTHTRTKSEIGTYTYTHPKL